MAVTAVHHRSLRVRLLVPGVSFGVARPAVGRLIQIDCRARSIVEKSLRQAPLQAARRGMSAGRPRSGRAADSRGVESSR